MLLDADDPATMARPDAPDPTAWGLHGALHRICPHARCAMHVHSVHATVLATLADPTLPPIDQNAAMFFNRVAVDPDYGGLALEAEAERVCRHLADPAKRVLVMANHGVMVVGSSVADAFNRLYYFERAAETYIKALWTGPAARRCCRTRSPRRRRGRSRPIPARRRSSWPRSWRCSTATARTSATDGTDARVSQSDPARDRLR